MVSAALALTGCGGDDAPPERSQAPARSSSATASPGTTTATPTVAPPTLPAAAQTPDAAGAEAFTRYFWQLTDFAFNTGLTEGLETNSRPECAACSETVKNIREVYSQGQSISGGTTSLREVVATPADPEAGLEVRAIFSQEAFDVVDTEGALLQQNPATDEFLMLMVVRWDGSAWRVAEWGKDDGQ